MVGIEGVKAQAVAGSKIYNQTSKLGLDSASSNDPVKAANQQQADFREAVNSFAANPAEAGKGIKFSSSASGSSAIHREDPVNIAGHAIEGSPSDIASEAISSVKSGIDKPGKTTNAYLNSEASQVDLTTAIKSGEFSTKAASTVLEKLRDAVSNIFSIQL